MIRRTIAIEIFFGIQLESIYYGDVANVFAMNSDACLLVH